MWSLWNRVPVFKAHGLWQPFNGEKTPVAPNLELEDSKGSTEERENAAVIERDMQTSITGADLGGESDATNFWCL
jgi:hypothetical protein